MGQCCGDVTVCVSRFRSGKQVVESMFEAVGVSKSASEAGSAEHSSEPATNLHELTCACHRSLVCLAWL